MRYLKIRGKSTSELMMKIRAEYGQSAYIMATREVREGGILGSGLLSKKLYEIEFMLPESTTTRKRSIPDEPSKPPRPDEMEFNQEGRSRVRSASFRRMARDDTGRAVDAGSPSEGRRGGGAPLSAVEAGAIGRSLRERPEGRTGGVDEILSRDTSAEEILSLLNEGEFNAPASPERIGATSPKSEVTHAAASEGGDPGSALLPPVPPPPATVGAQSAIRSLHEIRRRFLGAHLSNEFVETFLSDLEQKLSAVDRREYRRVEERALVELAEHIRTVPDVAPVRGECRAVMLVGPTGSGKTTSVAKLAARYCLYENRDVSLYSIDHCRLAATEQLRSYASIIDVPFQAPLNPADFAEQIRRDGAELMLIDTHGIGYRDVAKIRELAEYARACEVRLEKHLVLAANMSPHLVEKILLAYDELGFDRIILTKLDEADFIGAFVEHADKLNRPFSFLMNGQEVTEDIRDARPEDMARMVLRGERAEAVHF